VGIFHSAQPEQDDEAAGETEELAAGDSFALRRCWLRATARF
jgi:hypothetical protein